MAHSMRRIASVSVRPVNFWQPSVVSTLERVMTKWVGVALVAVSVCVLIGVTLLALSVYAVVTHVDIEGTNERRAAERFQEIRGRFSGQTPMLTVDGAGPTRHR